MSCDRSKRAGHVGGAHLARVQNVVLSRHLRFNWGLVTAFSMHSAFHVHQIVDWRPLPFQIESLDTSGELLRLTTLPRGGCGVASADL
jgi:hypothetical protein